MQMVKARCENCNGMLKFNAKYGLLICPLCDAVYILKTGHHKKDGKLMRCKSMYSAKYGWCDDLFPDAGLYVIRAGKAYIGFIQRTLKIGFRRSAKILDELAENGVIGKGQVSEQRDILMKAADFIAYCKEKGINMCDVQELQK